ncbi:MAG: hypothetical protein ACPF9D_11885 [Owenweeksia sp.]
MIRKSITLYFLTLTIGSFIMAIILLIMAGNPEWEGVLIGGWTFIGSILFSFLLSLPLLIPILIFYGILYFLKPAPRVYYILSAAIGPILTSAWMLVLTSFFHKEPYDFMIYWICYGVASGIAGVLVAYLDLKGRLQPVFKDPRKVY